MVLPEIVPAFRGVRLNTSCKLKLPRVTYVPIYLGLTIMLVYAAKTVYEGSPLYCVYNFFCFHKPIISYSNEIAAALREFIAALPSSMKRSLVCTEGSMAYRYVLWWLQKAEAHHVINGLVVNTILPDGTLDVGIQWQSWRICYIVKDRNFSCPYNVWLDHVPFYSRWEIFEITFIPADRYKDNVNKFVLTNKSYTRLADLCRWCALAYTHYVHHIPWTAHREFTDDQLVDRDYFEMYRDVTDRRANLAAVGRAGAEFPRGAGQVCNGATLYDSGGTAILIAAADRNNNRSGYPQTVNRSRYPH